MKSISFRELTNINKLSPHQLNILTFQNHNIESVGNLLDRRLKNSDKGIEVGSDNYISKSSHYFLRSKAFQEHSYLPQLEIDSFVPVKPTAFKQYHLKAEDILITKDSNIGEVIILDEDYPNFMFSGAIYRLPVTKNKYYVLAFLKSSVFKNQLDEMVPKGATIRHAGTKFLDCKIPFPTQQNSKQIIKYVELLVRSIINKQIEIKRKNTKILNIIENELLKNQKNYVFQYRHPNLQDIKLMGRLDVGVYSEAFQKTNFLVTNYTYGHKDLISRGYKWSRGTSLEIKGLGTRLNSDTYKDGFYELVTPTDISEFGTIIKSSFIGTSKKLKTIRQGDIIFGGEGFLKGRSFVVCEKVDNIATNYHGIRIYREDPDLIDSIFIRCFLAYWRAKGMIDAIGVGGSGGHCAPQYFPLIETPLFPENVKEEIANLYHNPAAYPIDLNEENFLIKDMEWNQQAGIYEIDKNMKKTNEHLNKVIMQIVNDEEVKISFTP